MKSNIQEKVNELQLKASEFLTNSKLLLNRLTIYPKEIEVYYYKDEEFEDNSVNCRRTIKTIYIYTEED